MAASMSDALRDRARRAARAAKRRAPVPVKRAANGALAAADPLVRRRWEAGHANGMPLPPRELRRAVGAPAIDDFVRDGERAARELLAVLDGHGRPIGGFSSVFDWGCGCGRLLRTIRPELGRDAALSGSDIDSRSIEWLRGVVPEGRFFVNATWPPLDAPDGGFDLVYGISVFTHFDRDKESAWLAEIARVLAPGGLAVLTVMGEQLYDRYRQGLRAGLSSGQLARLRAHGPLAEERMVFEPDDPELLASRSPEQRGDTYGLAFHSAGYVRERWNEILEVESIVPGAINWGQDAVLATRRADPA